MKITESLNLHNTVRLLRQGTPSGDSQPSAGESAPQSKDAYTADPPAQTPAPEQSATYVNYRVEKQTGTVVTKVIREKSGEIVRQIPPDENLKLAARLRQVLEQVRRK
ncbi:MAG: flagellar protein FlaG [Candidatus Tectomicrobia bacterium]|uniref:Flagellar protein FlaG n=1 Tax=Tectimicrobiota bacterium TaxID=2528274 RepID=A0A932GNF6_UNCTE|nr:flagellar protein FlaG [Candidatus Tectomicrobia bacterium]